MRRQEDDTAPAVFLVKDDRAGLEQLMQMRREAGGLETYFRGS